MIGSTLQHIVLMLKYCVTSQCYFEHMHKAVGANAQNQGLRARERSGSHFDIESADMLYF